MKKKYLLAAMLLYSACVMSQSKPLSEVVNISLPDHAIKLSTRQVTSLNDNVFKGSETNATDKNVYQIGNIILSFKDLAISQNNRKTLQQSKDELLELLKRDNNNVILKSELIVVNNIKFLTLKYRHNNKLILRFYSDYNNNKNLSGKVEYDDNDEHLAVDIFKNIIKSITFK